MLSINNYIDDGFEKVCDVTSDALNHWWYKNINESLMYDRHWSWVYFIVVDDKIYKVGETGNLLGIKSSWMLGNDVQPVTGSKSRLGRYRKGDQTDEFVRNSLAKEAQQGKVSIWARKCEAVKTNIKIAGITKPTYSCFHKELEKQYLDHIVKHTGNLPLLNKGRA